MLAGGRPVGRERERVRPGHDQLPVGEVDEPQDAEDESDPDRHQRVDRAEADRVDQGLGIDPQATIMRGTPAIIFVGVVRVGRGQRHPQLPVREHVGPVGERDRALRALLDEQDRDAAVADLRERREDRVDEGRREAERRLVEEEHVGRGDERAADRELLLLAAGERAGLAVAEVGEHREELVRRRERVRAVAAAASREAEPQVLLHRELAEDAPALRHERDAGPRDRLRRAAAHGLAGEAHIAGRRRARRP